MNEKKTSVALQPRRAKTDWSGCCQMAVKRAFWLVNHLSLNLNFSFLNRISLLLISSSYPIVLTRLGGPRSKSYTFRKIPRVYPGIKPGISWMAVKWANHYTKHAVHMKENRIHYPIWYIDHLYDWKLPHLSTLVKLLPGFLSLQWKTCLWA